MDKAVNLYPIDYPFETLISRVEKGTLRLNPDFQRKYKWNKENEEKTSRFIESCLMRIPLPACYFAEDEEKKHIVIDGVQRITTINRFFKDEFELVGLSEFSDLNGKKFSQLGDYKQDLETYTIRCIILRKDNSKELIKDIFARLNQGAVELTDQEIRHAIYQGKFNELIHELAGNEIISNFSKNNSNDDLQKDEQILRFFAMQGDLSDYTGKLSKYLDKCMERNQNLSDEFIAEYKEKFESTLAKCIEVFGHDKIFMDTNKERPKQSMVYYDLLMWSFIDIDIDTLRKNKEEIKSKFSELCSNEEFQKTLSGGLQNKSSIIKRRKLWSELLNEYKVI